MSKREEADRIVARILDALDEEPIDAVEADEAVRALGIDVKAMASEIRRSIDAHVEASRRARFAAAERQRLFDLSRLEALPAEPARPRAEQIRVLSSLVAKAGPHASVHFMKFEDATDEDLARMVAELRYLIEDDS